MLATAAALRNVRDARNVIVDGHVLAVRCARSAGLAKLRDGRGRPTGTIVGVLRGLKLLAKAFRGAALHVVWDGSSARRKAILLEYKANREPLRASFEVEHLKKLLPALGVRQAWNPDEEADDVVGTLVRGPLLGQENLIVTTDRDLLQLVDRTTRVFAPKGAGVSKGQPVGKFYDADAVEEAFGVPPDRMVDLRAIVGDVSDNLLGAKGFGLKKAAKLVKAFGGVDGICANLDKLTKLQRRCMQDAEARVRLNLELMRILTDLPLECVDPAPDRAAALKLLLDVDVRPDPFLKAFLC